MNKKLYTNSFIILFLIIAIPLTGIAQITGSVFRDVNNDGIQQLINPTEPGEQGINVKAYNASNVMVASVTTNVLGIYTIGILQAPPGTPIRLEFNLPAGIFPSKRINGNRSNVQFVTAGLSALNINFAVASKTLLADNSNPYVATTAYTNGNAIGTGGPNNAGNYDNLYVFPYDLSSDGGNSRRAKNRYTGAVFGLAWQKESRTLFMSAYLKRHCSLGPDGIGAIYQSQISTNGNPANPSLLVDVSSIGINVGTDPRTVALPTNAGSPNTDVGVFAEVGKRGIGSIELSSDGRDLYIVNMYEKRLHRINVGNPIKSTITAADVTGNWNIPDPSIPGTVWHPMALKMKNNKFYIGGVTARETTTAHNIADTANLRGIVYEFDPTTNAFTEVLRFPLSHRRGYVNTDYRYEYRNNYWCAWQNSGDITLGGPLRSGLIGSTIGSNATGIYYPQPMFSAIEFDADGSMIIGIRDRMGDQGGYANYFETGNAPGETYRTLATGEVLRAGKSGSTWNIENGGSVTSNGVTTTTPGVTSNNWLMTGSFTGQTGTPYAGNYGPGGAYYYYNFNYSMVGVPAPFNAGTPYRSHYLKSNGGLAYLPGYNEVITTAIDPVSTAYSNGIIKNVNLGAQAGNMAANMDLMVSSGADPATMGKAAALGDVEVLINAAAMEIGNRIWNDVNTNGIQDAGEAGMAGVDVVLRSPGADNAYNTADDQTWTVTTDADGNYYFDETIVNDSRRPSEWIGVSNTHSGILPGFEYRLEIFGFQPALQLYQLTAVNASYDEIDSEGNMNGSYIYQIINPGGSTAAGNSFENSYNVDFGFYNYAILPLNKLELSANLNSSNVNVAWKTTDELDVSSYELERSTDGTHFSFINSVFSKGNGSFAYNYNDDVKSLTVKNIYYRVKAVNKSGTAIYSAIVKVDLNNAIKITAGPNPFVNYLNIQVTAEKKSELSITLYNTAGQKVYIQQMVIERGNSSFVLNEFARLPKGMYVADISSGENRLKQKLIKQ